MSIEMLEAGPKGAKVLSVFDFDGTLTRHDSFVRSFGLPSALASSPSILRLALPTEGISPGACRDELKAS